MSKTYDAELVKLLAECKSDELETIQRLASEEDPEKVELIKVLANKNREELEMILDVLPE